MTDRVKDTSNKLQVGLLWRDCADAVCTIAAVMQWGNTRPEKPYTPGSWRGVSEADLTDAAIRHLLKIHTERAYDEESGFSHLAHAIANLMFALQNRIENGKNSVQQSV